MRIRSKRARSQAAAFLCARLHQSGAVADGVQRHLRERTTECVRRKCLVLFLSPYGIGDIHAERMPWTCAWYHNGAEMLAKHPERSRCQLSQINVHAYIYPDPAVFVWCSSLTKANRRPSHTGFMYAWSSYVCPLAMLVVGRVLQQELSTHTRICMLL